MNYKKLSILVGGMIRSMHLPHPLRKLQTWPLILRPLLIFSHILVYLRQCTSLLVHLLRPKSAMNWLKTYQTIAHVSIYVVMDMEDN